MQNREVSSGNLGTFAFSPTRVSSAKRPASPVPESKCHASSCNCVGRCRYAGGGKHIFGICADAGAEIFRRNRGREQATGGKTRKLPASGETAEIGFSETSQLRARLHESQELGREPINLIG